MKPYIVVDASVAGAWSFAEPSSAHAQLVLEAIWHQCVEALAPTRFVEEVLRVCQKKTLPPPVGALIPVGDAWNRFLDVVTSPILFQPCEELHDRAWQIAIAAGVTTHDALYLAAAEFWDAELWTLDDRLAGVSAGTFADVRHLGSTPFPY